MSDMVDVTRHERKTMQRLFVSHVKSIYLRIPSVSVSSNFSLRFSLFGGSGEMSYAYIHVAHISTAMVHAAMTHVSVIHV